MAESYLIGPWTVWKEVLHRMCVQVRGLSLSPKVRVQKIPPRKSAHMMENCLVIFNICRLRPPRIAWDFCALHNQVHLLNWRTTCWCNRLCIDWLTLIYRQKYLFSLAKIWRVFYIDSIPRCLTIYQVFYNINIRMYDTLFNNNLKYYYKIL